MMGNYRQSLTASGYHPKNESSPELGAQHVGDELQTATGADEDIKFTRTRPPPNIGDDESRLDLCLGVSLGGSRILVGEGTSENAPKEFVGRVERGGERFKEEDSPGLSKSDGGLRRRATDAGVSPNLAFWQEFSVSRDSLEESTAAVALQFWPAVQGTPRRAVTADGNEEKPILKDLLRLHQKAGTASNWSQAYSLQANRAKNSMQVNGHDTNEADGGPGPPEQSTSLGKRDGFYHDEIGKITAEQQLQHGQDGMHPQNNHEMREAGRKRKTFMDEHKLEKIATNEDDFKWFYGQSVNASVSNDNDDGKQLLELRRTLKLERDRAAKERVRELSKEKQPEQKTIIVDSPWMQGMEEMGVMAPELKGNEMILKSLPDLNGFQKSSHLSVTSTALPTMGRERGETFAQRTMQHAQFSEYRSELENRAAGSASIAGLNCNTNLINRSADPSKDTRITYSAPQTVRAVPLHSGQFQGGAAVPVESAPTVPTTPQFGLVQPWSGSREGFDYQNGHVNRNHIDLHLNEDLGGLTTSDNVANQGGAESSSIIPDSHNEDGNSIQGSRFHHGTTHEFTAESLLIHLGQAASGLTLGTATGQIFGGNASLPDLPWVTSTGAESNRSISGVIYRHERVVRIVCACHGCHMSPSEFVEHADSVDLASPERNSLAGSPTTGNQGASVKS